MVRFSGKNIVDLKFGALAIFWRNQCKHVPLLEFSGGKACKPREGGVDLLDTAAEIREHHAERRLGKCRAKHRVARVQCLLEVFVRRGIADDLREAEKLSGVVLE